MKRTLIIGAALAAILLSGCEALHEERQNYLDREEKITNVVGNVWRIEAVWPGYIEGNRLADHLHERARSHCGDRGMAMLPVNGSSTNGTKDGKRRLPPGSSSAARRASATVPSTRDSREASPSTI